MDTEELIMELKALVDSGDRGAKSEIQRLCKVLKSGGHDRYFIADGHKRKRWEEHISWVYSYSMHPSHQSKAQGAISMMRAGLPEHQ
jgi:hypothetical protein